MSRSLTWVERLALLAVPAKWRESVRQDLEEERACGVGFAAACWHAIAIGVALRRQRDDAAAARGIGQAARGDLIHALRGLRREPSASAAVVLTLAIGIGAAAAAHAVFNFALFRPTPGVADEASLVSIQVNYMAERAGEPMRIVETPPPAHFQAMRAAATGLTALSGAGRVTLSYAPVPGTPPRSMLLWWVTRDYFQVLGVRARVGSVFAGDDYDERGASTVLISESLWRADFAGRPDIVGQPITIGGDIFTIRGVAADFRGPEKLGDVDIWVSSAAKHTLIGDKPNDSWPWPAAMFGRLKPGVGIDAVQQQLQAAWQSAGPVRAGGAPVLPRVYAGLGNGETTRIEWLLGIYRVVMTGVGVLLLLACANAANLLLARHARRGREFAVRAAIGASRWRLVRMMLVEAALTAALASGAGVVIAVGLLQAFRSLRIVSFLPVLEDLAIDWRVVAFALAVSIVTLMVSSLLPALIASRPNPAATLHLHAAPNTTKATGLRQALVVVQLAASLVLLAGAGVLVQTVANLRGVDVGLDAQATKQFFLSMDLAAGNPGRRREIIQNVVSALRVAPGIEAVAVSKSMPMRFTTQMRVQPGDGPELQVGSQQVTPDYFDLLRIAVIAGRTFTATDAPVGKSSVVPAVVNAQFVATAFGGAAPLGRRFVAPAGRSPVTYEIVGVVANTRTSNLRAAYQPAVYEPIDLEAGGRLILMRTAMSSAAATEVMRGIVASLYPTIPVNPVVAATDEIETRISEERLMARLSAIVATLSLALACAGLYAVVAYFVTERTREFGIRIALGASRSRIATAILRRVAALAALGCIAGVAGAAWSGRFLASRLFGVSAVDVPTIAGAVIVLFLTALLATWLPARRASRIDPAITLRT